MHTAYNCGAIHGRLKQCRRLVLYFPLIICFAWRGLSLGVYPSLEQMCSGRTFWTRRWPRCAALPWEVEKNWAQKNGEERRHHRHDLERRREVKEDTALLYRHFIGFSLIEQCTVEHIQYITPTTLPVSVGLSRGDCPEASLFAPYAGYMTS